MKVINGRSALLSNYEVLQLLRERQDYQKSVQAANPSVEYPENLRTIQFELTEYLNGTPCSTQSPEQLSRFLEAMSQFSLTRGEKLQILNLRPKSAVEIYLLIEECEERFQEEELDAMINIVLETLPRDDDYVEEEEQAEEQAAEEMDEAEG